MESGCICRNEIRVGGYFDDPDRQFVESQDAGSDIACITPYRKAGDFSDKPAVYLFLHWSGA